MVRRRTVTRTPLLQEPVMAQDIDYMTLSKRFESFAVRCSDPMLADAYRKLAQTYRALDFWHERFSQRYETTLNTAKDDKSGGPAPDEG
jgi:hypothetical protein